jgi:mannosyltransferase
MMPLVKPSSRDAWLLAPLTAAVLCAALAILVDTLTWVERLQHPARAIAPETTWDGAELLRIMLLVGAAALVGIPWTLHRLTPPAAAVETAAVPSRELWHVFGLILVAICLRATRLGESLWYDEIAAWLAFGTHGPGAIVGNFFEPSNHVAHTLATWASVVFLGTWTDSFEIALRLPAFLASLASVAAVYALARRALGPGGALIAAALVAVWPVSVLEGAEARGYSMMILAAALSSWLVVAMQERESAWGWCLYALICALGVWAHFVTAFVPIGHAVWLGWRARAAGELGRAVRGAMALVLAGVLTLLLYAPALPDLLAHRGDYVAARGDEPRLWGAEGWHAFLQLGGSWYAWVAWPGLVLAGMGLWRLRADRRLRAVAVPALLGLPVLVVIVLVAGSWMYARFCLFCVPGAALLAAAGIDRLRRWRPAAALAVGAVVAAASVADLAVRPSKQPLRAAAAWIFAHRAEDDDILVIGLAHRVMDLYLGTLDPAYSLRHGADLAGRLRHAQPAWVVVYYPNHVSDESYTILAEGGYDEAARFEGWVDWGEGDVVVFAR